MQDSDSDSVIEHLVEADQAEALAKAYPDANWGLLVKPDQSQLGG